MEELIGFVAAILTTIAYLPQMIKIIKSKSAKDVSLSMYIVMCSGIFMWLVYGLLISSYPVIFANAITLVFVTIILIYKMRYK